jgi:glycosyltransferase involved in cell wall biosynthesis
MYERLRLLYLADGPCDQVDGVAFAGDPTTPPYPETCQTYVAYLFGESVESGASECGSPAYALRLSRSNWMWNPLARLRVMRLIRKIDPGAICTHGPVARILALSAAHSLGVPSRLVRATDMGQTLTSDLLRPIIRADCHATRFITDSFSAAQRLVRQEQVSRDRIEVMPWGVAPEFICHRDETSVAEAKHRMGLSAHEPVIIAAGCSMRTQDYETLFFAVRQLSPHQKQVRLVIWGAGDQGKIEELRSGIARHGIEENVILPPPSTPLDSWIAAADMGVVTSYVESISGYMLRYMAAGLAICAVNVAGNAELIRHGESGYLVDFRDSDQLAMFMTILLLSPELAERFGEAARERVVQNHSFERALHARNDYFRTLSYSHARSH